MLTRWLDQDVKCEPHLAVADTEIYDGLFACFLSDQMTTAQLLQHMDEDSAFKTFVDRRLRIDESIALSESAFVTALH